MDEPPQDIVDRHRPLTIEVAADTCDRCGVRAYVYAEMPSGRTLAYCAHHGTEYWAQLTRQADHVIDLRHLVPK